MKNFLSAILAAACLSTSAMATPSQSMSTIDNSSLLTQAESFVGHALALGLNSITSKASDERTLQADQKQGKDMHPNCVYIGRNKYCDYKSQRCCPTPS